MSMSAKPCDKKGVIVLGDAFNMRHPIIASGMMVALSDVLIIRNLLRSLPNIGNTKKVSELIKSFYIIRKVGCLYKCVKVHGIYISKNIAISEATHIILYSRLGHVRRIYDSFS